MAIINQRWPTDICPQSCVFAPSRNDVQLRNPYTRAPVNIQRGRRLWTAKLEWQVPNTSKLAKLRYWLEALDGYAGSVQLWDFGSPWPVGVTLGASASLAQSQWVSGALARSVFRTSGGVASQWVAGNSVTVTTAAAIGATSIIVGGFTPNTTACIQGQYVQIGRRLYVASADVLANGSGVATLTILKGLISAASVGTAVYVQQAACEMQLDSQDWSGATTAGEGMSRISASFIETVTDF